MPRSSWRITPAGRTGTTSGSASAARRVARQLRRARSTSKRATTTPSAAKLPLTLRTLKVARRRTPAPLCICIRRRVELPERDRRGEPVTSCVIEPDRRSGEDREAERIAVVEATSRETDLAVLRAMRDYPAATSIARLRTYVSAAHRSGQRGRGAHPPGAARHRRQAGATLHGHHGWRASLNGGHP